RYITLRKFEKAIADLEKAAQLIEGTKDTVEPDGMPNEKNIPVSTLHGNIYYHLGLAYYLKHDMENALSAFNKALHTSTNPDNIVATSHWLYMIHRRMGNETAAEAVVKPITEDMDVIENQAYHRACLFYKGAIELNALNNNPQAPEASKSALSYAVGNWLYYTGNAAQAEKVFEIMMEQDDWTSFGYIAAESDLAKLY
ncbi:MAG: tetratricopeptide repeat protein, partial [Altibacter sp.]|nr:tetratricopeptide repeat protein [Altibacter sp.]